MDTIHSGSEKEVLKSTANGPVETSDLGLASAKPPAFQFKSSDEKRESEKQDSSTLVETPYQFANSASLPTQNINNSSQTPFQLAKESTSEAPSSDEMSEQAFQLTSVGTTPPPSDPNAGNRDNSHTPNNTGLPTQLKSGMESLSGYSLDDVNVHYNSDKPAQLKAQAYAQGTDIHLGAGQEQHLPHEAWHVVQQKQGRVQPTTQFKAFNINDDEGLENEADVMGKKAMQFKSKGADNIHKTAVLAITNPIQMAESKYAKAKREREERKQNRNSGDAKNVAIDGLQSITKLDAIGDQNGSNHNLLKAGSGLLSTAAKGTGEAKSQILTTKDANDQDVALAGNSEANIAGNSAASLVGFLDICMTIKDMKDNGGMNPKMIDQILGLVKSGATVVKAVSNASKTAGNSGEAVAKKAGSVAGGFQVLKNFVEMVVGIYKDYKAATSDIGSSGAEKFEAVARAIQGALATVQSSLFFVKSVAGIVGQATTIALDEVKKMIPGVGLLMNGVNIAMEVYSMVKSETARRNMKAEKKGLKNQFGDKVTKESKFQKSRKTSKKKIQAAIDDLDDKNKPLDESIGVLQDSIDNLETPISEKEKLIKKLEQILAKKEADYNRRKKKAIKNKKKFPIYTFSAKKKKIADAKAELNELKSERSTLKDQQSVPKTLKSINESEKGDLKHLSFLQSMQKLNKTRNADSLFKIGRELISAAGDISTLTVVGAAAGTPLKLIASGAGIAKDGATSLRQAGRNAAAKKYNKREENNGDVDDLSLTEKVFNKDKSDNGLKKQKLEHAQHILKMYSQIDPIVTTTNTEAMQNTEKERLEGYIKAAGADPMAVYRAFYGAKGRPAEALVPGTKFKKEIPAKEEITDEQAKISAFLSTIAGAM